MVLKPLAYLPYRAAYGLFTLATLGAFLWFVIRFYKECPALPFFAAFSLPMAIAEWNGQDPAFLVAIVGASILLMRARRDFLAGLVFSLCLLKPHLFLFVALLLLLKKRWPMIAGGATGVAALTLLGVAYNGVGSIPGWIATMQNPWINGEAAWMPNLHGLTAALDAPAVVEPVLIALTVALFLWLTRKVESFELLFAAALLCGLLANVHAALSDDILLMPVMVLVTGATQCKSLRIASALVLTPVPYFLAMAGPPYGALVPIALLVQLSLFGVAAAAKNYDATSSRVITSV
ncbi:MAG: glycosyltransferase family 87 protein [Acidobacteriota bacterium]